MVSAEEDIQYLILIVRKDEDIQRKRRLIETAPSRIAIVDSDIYKMDKQFSENRDAVSALEAEKKELLDKIDAQNKNIAQKKIARAKFIDPKEFKAMGHEIDYLESLVDKEEERILTILDQMAERARELEKIQRKIDNDKNALIDEKRKLEEEIARNRDLLIRLEDEKSRILPNLSGKVKRLYERINEAKGDSGVANLVGDICQGCHSRVPPQKAHEIRKNDTIIICEVCGRILVFYKEEPSY